MPYVSANAEPMEVSMLVYSLYSVFASAIGLHADVKGISFLIQALGLSNCLGPQGYLDRSTLKQIM